MVRLADEKLNPDIIIIDDGFQRTDIDTDINILILPSQLLKEASGESRRITCYPFPRGVLREPIASLQRADQFFVIKEMEDESDFSAFLKKYNSRAMVIPWTMSFSEVKVNGATEAFSNLKDKRPYLFASIGSYYRLLRMVRNYGIDPPGDYNFGDHHSYSEKDFRNLKRWSDHHSADCYLTTAKDMVKLPPDGLDKPVYCLKLNIRPDNESGLEEILDTGRS
jgi:tetraacyldisaccharide 4'-kinase